MEDLKPFEIFTEIRGEELLAASILSLIATQLDEIPFLRNYGSTTSTQVDAPEPAAVARVRASIAKALDGAIDGLSLVRVGLTESMRFQIVCRYEGNQIEVTA